MNDALSYRVAFIGTAGVPNRYGGFEAFLEHCAPAIAALTALTMVTCDKRLYKDRSSDFHDVQRRFLPIPANGAWSVLHDLLAFITVYTSSTHIVVLGVSGGPWFPLFRLLCALGGKKLIVNVDGVEWQRGKFIYFKKIFLRIFDAVAQVCAHTVIYDNAALYQFIMPICRSKARLIAYSGDHVVRNKDVIREPHRALTICRIEPENNIPMLIEGALQSGIELYTIIGNWTNSAYGRNLKEIYGSNPRLALLNPIYDPGKLSFFREACSIYIHGHSVGGTNPSLVEMLFYDCRILCFDVPFHRETAGPCAQYFSSVEQLATLLSKETLGGNDREWRRLQYSREVIVSKYLSAMMS